jgi:UDP-glucose 4-epimerase
MTILLTGGAGYIGSHVLLCCLEAGHEVVVLDDFSNSSPEALARVEGLTAERVTIWRGDIRDGTLLRQIFARHKIDAVLHFAGLKAVGESVADPLAYYDVNLGGSVTLAGAMAAAGVFRLVFSSTAAVYGDQARMPLTETSAVAPSSPYGRSKLMVEQLLADLCTADPRWSVAVLRYFNPAGAHPSGRIGEDPRGVPANLIPYAMQVAVGRCPELAIFGNDYPPPDGTGIRDYIHVSDLCRAHVLAMERLLSGGPARGAQYYNLANGRGFSVREIISACRNVTGQPITYRAMPRRAGDTAELVGDARLATDVLCWRPRFVELEQIIQTAWEWMPLKGTH